MNIDDIDHYIRPPSQNLSAGIRSITPDLRVYSCAFSAFWQDRRAVRAVVTPGSRSSGERGDLAIFPGIGRKFDALRNRRTSDVGDGSIASVGLSWHVGFTPNSGRIAITVFKYSDTAMKAMTENPQDRGAAAAKLGSVRRQDGGRLLVFVRW